MKRILPTALLISLGFVTLLGFFIQNAILLAIRLALTEWAVILAGLALLLGMLNLLIVHLRKMQSATRGWPYSVLVVLSAIAVLALGLLEGPQAITQETSAIQVVFTGILSATQAALAGLVVFSLVYAAVRMFDRQPGLTTTSFLLVVVIVLLGWLPISLIQGSPLPGLRNWLLAVPATAGARGILLGVALGTVTLGLRVLVGAEWPYRES